MNNSHTGLVHDDMPKVVEPIVLSSNVDEHDMKVVSHIHVTYPSHTHHIRITYASHSTYALPKGASLHQLVDKLTSFVLTLSLSTGNYCKTSYADSS